MWADPNECYPRVYTLSAGSTIDLLKINAPDLRQSPPSLPLCLSLSRSAFSYRHTDDRTSFSCKHPSRGQGRVASIYMCYERSIQIRKVIANPFDTIDSRYFVKIFLVVPTSVAFIHRLKNVFILIFI